MEGVKQRTLSYAKRATRPARPAGRSTEREVGIASSRSCERAALAWPPYGDLKRSHRHRQRHQIGRLRAHPAHQPRPDACHGRWLHLKRGRQRCHMCFRACRRFTCPRSSAASRALSRSRRPAPSAARTHCRSRSRPGATCIRPQSARPSRSAHAAASTPLGFFMPCIDIGAGLGWPGQLDSVSGRPWIRGDETVSKVA